MTFANPLGLLWLLAVPAVVLLHLFRRQLVERRIAALFLFPGERLVAQAGRTRTRLLHTPSLWLECLAAIALALWLAGLSFGGAAARHVVFVLDDSASMAAGGAVRAAPAVRAAAAGLSGRDRVTSVRTGPRPDIVLGPAAAPHEVGDALARWLPSRPRHDPTPALDMARELAGVAGEVVFWTDEAPPTPLVGVTVQAFGESAPNCALQSARRVPRAGGEDLVVRIAGFGAVTDTEFVVRAGEQELAREAVVLQAGLADLVLRLPPDTGALHLQLRKDALPIDDEAWLLPAPDRTVAVCDLLPEALHAQLQLPRVFAALSGYRRVADPREAQLVIADKPGVLRPGQLEVVFATGDGEPEAWRGPFVVDRAHGVVEGVQLHGVVWGARRRTLPGHVLVAAAARALVTEEALDTGRRLWLDLDPGAGNLVRSPDWPVLWANVLEACRTEVAGVQAPNVLLGGEATFRRSLLAGAADTEVVLVAPDGERTVGKGVRTTGFLLQQPGVHRLLGTGDQELGRVAARFFDPAESDLRGLAAGTWPAAAAVVSAAGPVHDMDVERRVLALLLLAFVLCDWWLLARSSGRTRAEASGGRVA